MDNNLNVTECDRYLISTIYEHAKLHKDADKIPVEISGKGMSSLQNYL